MLPAVAQASPAIGQGAAVTLIHLSNGIIPRTLLSYRGARRNIRPHDCPRRRSHRAPGECLRLGLVHLAARIAPAGNLPMISAIRRRLKSTRRWPLTGQAANCGLLTILF